MKCRIPSWLMYFGGLLLVSLLVLSTSPPNSESWEERMKQEYPVWGRLCAGTLQNFAVGGQALSRLDGARFVLENHPQSEFADDAALLAASFAWDIRSSATLQALADVIGRHAAGKFIVGDPTWQRYAPRLVRAEAGGAPQAVGLRADPWTTPSLVNAYFAHLETHPNYTGDEARLTLAEYLLRLGDTTGSLAQVDAILMKYPDAARANADLQAAAQGDGSLIAQILRTEERALLFRVAVHFRRTNDHVACLAAADHYVELYPDRPYGRYVQMIRGEIFEARNELAKAREAYLAAVSLLERHWAASTLNGLPIENCVLPVLREIVMRVLRIEEQLGLPRSDLAKWLW